MPDRSFVEVKRRLLLTALYALALAATPARADWPMAGHDPQRSSWAPEDVEPSNKKLVPKWSRRLCPEPGCDDKLNDFIPSKIHIITVQGAGESDDRLYVATSKGLYCLRPAAGLPTVWFYPMVLPAGHSPTVVNGVAYVSSFDKTIHAVDAKTGAKIWQTDEAGGGFDVSPLVVNGKIYAGNRDGRFYCFKASDGSMDWSFQTGGPITYSAAMSPENNTLYFASNDSHAYALDTGGGQKWKSPKLPGDGFFSFWPVVSGDYVLFPGSNNQAKTGTDLLVTLNKKEAFMLAIDTAPLDNDIDPTSEEGDYIGPIDANGWMEAQPFIDYYNSSPDRFTRRNLFVFHRTSWQETIAPILWIGNIGGNRYPPIAGPDNTVWTHTSWLYDAEKEPFLKGRLAAWKPGTSKIKTVPAINQVTQKWTGLDSSDENSAYALHGPNNLLYQHKEDQYGRSYTTDGVGTDRYQWDFTKGTGELPTALLNYWGDWWKRHYGSVGIGVVGTNGGVNPPVPIRDKVCMHGSSTVICFGPVAL